ncbi:phosphopantetheine-binding protein [Rhodococcus daqingensis]|uniref:Phosphopantetheine-binding protein n=1 Tax=Rhodococcus daqingensis TaxID=2479363 RepID=A0ABW2RYF5_9NOCA
MTITLTPDRVIADIADILEIGPAELSDDSNLLDFGMDSIRLISLVERWRALDARADIAALATVYLLSDWLAVIAGGSSESAPAPAQTRAR